MTSSLRVLSWNMHQTATSWQYLQDLAVRYQVDIALVQEARRPSVAPAMRCEPSFTDVERWCVPIPIGLRRRYCSAVVCFNNDLEVVPVQPTLLGETSYGGFAASHPGQFAVCTVATPGRRPVTVISLYGIWDTMSDTGEIYAYASLHRALSDLTPIIQSRDAQIILAGDLNVWQGYGGAPWEERYRVVFDRMASQGLKLVGPFRPDEQPALDDCPCGPRPGCRHVATFRYQSNPRNRPYQNDFVLATAELARVAVVTTVTEDALWLHSDHVPVIAEFPVDQEVAA